ncbi:MAG: phosphotransferase, partial [Chloroflexota bacterium]|nr:phosphotransferase [Chloroflexota bacterium]
SYRAALLARAQSRLCQLSSASYADLFEAVLGANEGAFAEPPAPCLTHDDLNPNNIVLSRKHVGGWRIAGILDFEAAWSGGAEPDLARLDFWHGMTSNRFWRAYQELAPISDSFVRRKQLLQFLWCLEYARRTPEHLGITASLCADLGIAPVTFE